jgi:predicted LPLAT superfamily acyltransferase
MTTAPQLAPAPPPSSLRIRFIRGLYRLTRRLGVGTMSAMAWLISSLYFLVYPRRVSRSMRFYRALFPQRGWWGRLACAWRQYKSFARLFVDRIALERDEEPTFHSDGWEHLEQAAKAKTGGVIVMSHMGNWEVAARLFRRRKLQMMIYMGIREGEEMERLQKRDLKADQLEVVAVSPEGASPLEGIRGLKFLKEGGFVSLAADRAVGTSQDRVEVDFLGGKLSVSTAPFTFAMVSRRPVFVFFSLREPDGSYTISATEPWQVRPASRKQRAEAIRQAAQDYAALLAEKVQRYPYQWYHFVEEPLRHDVKQETAAAGANDSSADQGG